MALTAMLLESLRLHHLAAVVTYNQIEVIMGRAVPEDGHVCKTEACVTGVKDPGCLYIKDALTPLLRRHSAFQLTCGLLGGCSQLPQSSLTRPKVYGLS